MESKWASVASSDLQSLHTLSRDKKDFLAELDHIRAFEEMRTQSEKTICEKKV
jgi:hypothetical protein